MGSVFFSVNDSVLLDCHRLRAWLREVGVKERVMNLETVLSLVASALLLVYLTYALLRPERF